MGFGEPIFPPLRTVRNDAPSVIWLFSSQRSRIRFDPVGDGASAFALAFDVEQHPALFAQLQMPQFQPDQFIAAQAASDQQGENGAIAQALSLFLNE